MSCRNMCFHAATTRSFVSRGKVLENDDDDGNDDDDDDDGDDDDTCFCGIIDQRRAFIPYFQPGPLSEILTIANVRHAPSRAGTCAEPEFRVYRMKLCSSKMNDKIQTQSSGGVL